MLISILKSYSALLISIGSASFFIFITGLYLIFRNPQSKKISSQNMAFETDFAAIAGDDPITTQLDLARAYIETDNKPLAASILKNIIKQGNSSQQQEAKQLMKHI